MTTPVQQTTKAGIPINYQLPDTTDFENDIVTISLDSATPTFVSLDSANNLNINPSLSDIGAFVA